MSASPAATYERKLMCSVRELPSTMYTAAMAAGSTRESSASVLARRSRSEALTAAACLAASDDAGSKRCVSTTRQWHADDWSKAESAALPDDDADADADTAADADDDADDACGRSKSCCMRAVIDSDDDEDEERGGLMLILMSLSSFDSA